MKSSLIAPVEMSVVVPLSPARAFTLFTSDMTKWWPLRTHSINQDKAASCGVDPVVDGMLFELDEEGNRAQWGRVIAWEPPDRVAYWWHPGHEPAEAQQVEVRFVPDGAGTRVTLRHFGWEALGEQAEAVREGYASGWQKVFGELYAEAARKEAE